MYVKNFRIDGFGRVLSFSVEKSVFKNGHIETNYRVGDKSLDYGSFIYFNEQKLGQINFYKFIEANKAEIHNMLSIITELPTFSRERFIVVEPTVIDMEFSEIVSFTKSCHEISENPPYFVEDLCKVAVKGLNRYCQPLINLFKNGNTDVEFWLGGRNFVSVRVRDRGRFESLLAKEHFSNQVLRRIYVGG